MLFDMTNLDQLISELQERNRETFTEANNEKLWTTVTEQLGEINPLLDKLTTDTAHAIALAVIVEVLDAANRFPIHEGRADLISLNDLEFHLTSLEAKIKDV